MSYGPQLPPHLQKQREETESSDSDDQIGPKLPEIACRGPKPKHDEAEEEDEEITIGPKLPDQASREPKPESSQKFYGPVLPTGLKSASAVQDEDDSSDDGELIGPLPPKPGEEISTQEALARQFEERAKKMKDKIDGKDVQAPPKRETWMLELPAALTKNFGMGPRSFSTKTGPKTTQDRSWTRAPTDGPVEESEQQNETEEPTDEKDVLEYMASLKRDSDMEKIANQLREKRGTESLMDRHAKKLKKAQEKEEASGRPKERRPFDRDIDLSANQFDEAKKKLMMKKASQLNDRFSSGGQKFL